jgi:hypothetical protein
MLFSGASPAEPTGCCYHNHSSTTTAKLAVYENFSFFYSSSYSSADPINVSTEEVSFVSGTCSLSETTLTLTGDANVQKVSINEAGDLEETEDLLRNHEVSILLTALTSSSEWVWGSWDKEREESDGE